MFEQRVLTAYREKVAAERQRKLLEELDEEDRLDGQREAKKAREAAKKKEKSGCKSRPRTKKRPKRTLTKQLRRLLSERPKTRNLKSSASIEKSSARNVRLKRKRLMKKDFARNPTSTGSSKKHATAKPNKNVRFVMQRSVSARSEKSPRRRSVMTEKPKRKRSKTRKQRKNKSEKPMRSTPGGRKRLR